MKIVAMCSYRNGILVACKDGQIYSYDRRRNPQWKEFARFPDPQEDLIASVTDELVWGIVRELCDPGEIFSAQEFKDRLFAHFEKYNPTPKTKAALWNEAYKPLQRFRYKRIAFTGDDPEVKKSNYKRLI